MLQVEGPLKTAPGPGSISRKVNPSLRCPETMQFRSRYQTSQMPCCAFPPGLHLSTSPGASLMRTKLNADLFHIND
jgi:hypothetical protein